MKDHILLIIAGLLVLSQLMTCIFVKKAWLRLLPITVTVLLTVFCFVMYLCGGQTNWGYIFLAGLLGIVVLAQGCVLLANCLIRRVTCH